MSWPLLENTRGLQLAATDPILTPPDPIWIHLGSDSGRGRSAAVNAGLCLLSFQWRDTGFNGHFRVKRKPMERSEDPRSPVVFPSVTVATAVFTEHLFRCLWTPEVGEQPVDSHQAELGRERIRIFLQHDCVFLQRIPSVLQ